MQLDTVLRKVSPRVRPTLLILGVLLIAASIVLIIAASDNGGDRIPRAALREAATFSQSRYRLYYLGDNYGGQSLTKVSRATGGNELAGRFFFYGNCEPEGEVIFGIEFIEGGCPLPYQVVNAHMCMAKPQVRRHPAAGRRLTIRGVPAFQYLEGQLDIYTSETTVGIEAPAQDSALEARRAARHLRSVDGEVGPGDPLPPPSRRGMEGKLKCPRTE